MASRDGYFCASRNIRRIGNTPVTPLLGGGTVASLLVADPLVAAGVAEHSSYDKDIWRRLIRTLRALYMITYGSKAEADLAADSVRAAHARVNGTTTEQLGIFPPHRDSGRRPALMLWGARDARARVPVCLLAILRARALSRGSILAVLPRLAIVAELGAPAERRPPPLADLREQSAAQIDGSTITVTRPAREIARAIYRSPLRGPMPMITFGAPARNHRPAPTLPAPGVRRPSSSRPVGIAAGRSRPPDTIRQPADPAGRGPHIRPREEPRPPDRSGCRGRATRLRLGFGRLGAMSHSRSLVGREWPAQPVALNHVAAEASELVADGTALDPFGATTLRPRSCPSVVIERTMAASSASLCMLDTNERSILSHGDREPREIRASEVRTWCRSRRSRRRLPAGGGGR